IFQENETLYLEVTIDGVVLSPRKRLTAAPYAINSQYLNGYTTDAASTTQYIPVANEHGNFLFRGTPQNNQVSGGVLYINPGSADPNDTLFGVALNGSERLRLNAEGD